MYDNHILQRILRFFRSITIGVFPVIIFLLLFLFPLKTAAQPGSQPGSQASRFRDISKGEQRALDKKKPKKPKIKIEEPEEKPAAPVGISFLLKKVVITGATVFKPEAFRPIYEPYLNRKVTFQDIEAIADKIKAKYKKKGYLTTIVHVPEQEISQGVVEIAIVEGRLGELKIEGNKYFSSSLIRKYIHTKKKEILNILKLQKDILRLDQNPDLELKTVISRGKLPGTSDVTIKVEEKFPYHAGTTVDNQGTYLTGKDRTAFLVRSSNLTGVNDSLFVNTMISSSSTGNFISYSAPVTTYGTRIGCDFSFFESKLGREYKTYDITGNSQYYTPSVSQELYLSDSLQVNVDAGIEINMITKQMRNQTTANDQLRIPFFGFDITALDSFLGGGQTFLSPQFNFGTGHFLGASSRGHTTSSRRGTGGFFFKYAQALNRIQKMPFESYISMRSQFLASSYKLPPSEQLQLGGAYSVRGYPEGDYLADIGASLTVEWVFPLYLLPKKLKLPYANTPLYKQITPVLFMDIGGGALKSASDGERTSKFLMGLGGGFRIRFNNNLYLRLDWAERVGDRPLQGQSPSNFYITFLFQS